jgi:hypothetical protein
VHQKLLQLILAIFEYVLLFIILFYGFCEMHCEILIIAEQLGLWSLGFLRATIENWHLWLLLLLVHTDGELILEVEFLKDYLQLLNVIVEICFSLDYNIIKGIEILTLSPSVRIARKS